MIRRRAGRIAVALGLAVGLVTVVASTAGAESAVTTAQAEKGFKGLKALKEPKSCPSQDGLTATEIKVGALIPNSGPSAASFGPARDGLDARIAKANAEKEVGNRQIKIVYGDDAGDTAKNLTVAQQLVEQDKVWAVVADSSAMDTSAKYLYDKGIPVVGWHLGLPSFGTYPNMFSWNSVAQDVASSYTTRTVDFMKQNGGTKVALVGTNQANSARVILQTEDAIKRTKGMETVYKTVDVPTGSTEFGAIAQQIKDSGATAAYTGMDTAANLALSTALKQAGSSVKVLVFPGGYSPQIVAAPALQGAYFGIEFKPFETTPPVPGYVDFNKWLPTGVVRSQVTAIGWLMGDLLVEGIKAAGVNCPTQDAFITNLRLEKDYTANGWYDPPKDFISLWNQPFPCAFFVQVVNNAFVPQNDNKPICAKQVIRNNKLSKELSAITPTTAAATTATTAAK
ncbi:MAG: ABC transporter substrate-binding protein [Acidimicrobiia bacterium]|jgi:ABC-type branched-subunit amino acid transport system substrate-binding protein